METKTMQQLTVMLAGNPNVGKSTLFNALTGMHQHTGNWPGKTVGVAKGSATYGENRITFVDLPGTYSLEGKSEDERIAGEYIRSQQADCTVVVCDGSCMERSLILALQILQTVGKAVVCVNLVDEAQQRGMQIHRQKLEQLLQVPVVLTAAGKKEGLQELVQSILRVHSAPPGLIREQWPDPVDAAQKISAQCTSCQEQKDDFRHRLDRLLVSRRFGMGLLFVLLLGIIWITVWGANYPSALLERGFDFLYGILDRVFSGAPWWLRGVLLDGLYSTCARVISVMLPPMAIFFPLFTILEDIGYLPRMAFLLDPCMARCGGCGKQALTLCMGLGCNAVGVMGCRIIDSPRERLAAILTNAMMPCNGRFPTLILLGSLFFPEAGAALVVSASVVLGAVGAMAACGVLSKTALHRESSTFLMEMPPFRRPRLGQILVRSVVERTLFVAGRALTAAAPAGIALWLAANFGIMNTLAALLQPLGAALGMNGLILLAFVFCLPANELLVPVLLMGLTNAGSLQAVAGVGEELLLHSMDAPMAVCVMVFTVFHWPCSTTLQTIYRETGSIKKTAAAFCLPTAVGCALCFALNLLL